MTDYSVSDARRISTSARRLIQAGRTWLFHLVILLWSLPFGLVIITLFQIWRPPPVVRWTLRLWSTGFVAAARWITGVNYVLEGMENIPAQPVIFVCNHQSYWESIAFTAFFPHINVVSKAGAMDIPVFGWGLRHAPMIPVHRDRRGGNLRRIVRDARASLAGGRNILFFPEGTRVPPGARRRYQRGLEMLYRECGVAIVPVAHNAGLCWAEGFRTKHAGLITIRFLPPVAPHGDPRQVTVGIERLLNGEKDTLAALPAREA